MNIKIDKYQPFISVVLENEDSRDIEVQCLIDTGFSGALAIPYFKGEGEFDSIVNQINFLDNPRSGMEKQYC